MSVTSVAIYGLMFRILTRFHTLYFGASCIHRNSIVWRRVNLARFPYWPEKRMRRISRYSYLPETLISSEYGLTISGHVTVLRQWPLEKNTDYIIILILSYPPVDDRTGPWNTAMNAACVLHITTALLHRSCDFFCFPLFSRPSVSFGAISVIVTSWFLPRYAHRYHRHILFRNLFVHYLMNQSFMASLAAVCGLFFQNKPNFWMLNSKFLLFFHFE